MNLKSKIARLIKITIPQELRFLRYKNKYIEKPFGFDIMSIDETLEYMSVPGHSIIRYGDGEFMYINGNELPDYQEYDENLANKLKGYLSEECNDSYLVCLPEPMRSIDSLKRKSQVYWVNNFEMHSISYKEIALKNKRYGNSFVSRPYVVFEDKEQSKKWIEKLISIFKDKDLVIVEGEYSRTGVGNDMLAKCRSVKRIICPSKNSFRKYNEILKAALDCSQNSLYLVALGPTAKVIAAELAQNGRWAFDIGHIDSEYEWYKRAADSKIILNNKHTAERPDEELGECNDLDYINSIIKRI